MTTKGAAVENNITNEFSVLFPVQNDTKLGLFWVFGKNVVHGLTTDGAAVKNNITNEFSIRIPVQNDTKLGLI